MSELYYGPVRWEGPRPRGAIADEAVERAARYLWDEHLALARWREDGTATSETWDECKLKHHVREIARGVLEVAL